LAIYSKACIPAVEQSIAAGQRRMISFFPQIELMTVDEQTLAQLDPKGLSFFNVNTPQDLQRAEHLLAQQSA
jgi:molybdopterin-guanine dinucleotide biosynthesis protein A